MQKTLNLLTLVYKTQT